MLRISVHRTVPGMVIALPVHHPGKADHVLLKPGAALDEGTIRALREYGVQEIYLKYPQTEFLLKYANPRLMEAKAGLIRDLGACFDTVSGDIHADMEFSAYTGAIASLLERILENRDAALFLGDLVGSSDALLCHSANVCYLSLLMGIKLDAYLITERNRIDPRRAQNVENLGLGALFHDIGMLRLSSDVRERWAKTHDESDPEFQKHVTLGFDTVRGKLPATASAAVLHHHQRLDGSGFPRKERIGGKATPLRGNEIHVFARIIAIAELFDRFRNAPCPSRPDSDAPGERVAAPSVRALRKVLAMVRTRKLDPVIFKALLVCAPAYPPGTFVTLSDKRTCIVTAFNPTRPCRPTVTEVKGYNPAESDIRLGEVIDLAEQAHLRIIACDGENVENDNFEAQYPGEFDLRVQYVPETPKPKGAKRGEQAGAGPAQAKSAA